MIEKILEIIRNLIEIDHIIQPFLEMELFPVLNKSKLKKRA